MELVVKEYSLSVNSIAQDKIDALLDYEGEGEDDLEEGKYFFIQQVLQLLNKKSQEYSEVRATVWISRGEHFFFQCLETVSEEDSRDASLQFNILC